VRALLKLSSSQSVFLAGSFPKMTVVFEAAIFFCSLRRF